MERKGIIFDLDGTMWDASHSNCAAWNRALEKHPEIERKFTEEELKGYMGKTLDQIALCAFPEMDICDSLPILKDCTREEIAALNQHGGILFPKLEETLAELVHQYHLYVVSNCQDGYIQAFLDFHHLNQYFEDIENAGRTGKGKADNIRIVVGRNNLDKAVYVGDTDGDFISAKEAGIPFIFAEYGFGHVENPEYVIESFEKLTDVVTEIL